MNQELMKLIRNFISESSFSSLNPPKEVKFKTSNGSIKECETEKERKPSIKLEENFSINKVNDLTIEVIKSEMKEYEDYQELGCMELCDIFHGGPLDNPKMTNASVGYVIERWDFCFNKLRNAKLEREKKYSIQSAKPKPGDIKRKTTDDEIFQVLEENKRLMSEEEEDIEEFISTVGESSSKFHHYHYSFIKLALKNGDMKNLLLVLGGITLIRNKLWFYNKYFEKSSFDQEYDLAIKLMEATSIQVSQYYRNLVSTTIIHDSDSQDWENEKAFYDGEKISHCIQMFWYFTQGLKWDLWTTVAPTAAKGIILDVVDDAYGIFLTRYSNIRPSSARVNQFRADISTLLLIISELLPQISTNIDQIFWSDRKPCKGGNDLIGYNLWSLNNKGWLLLKVLICITGPLNKLNEGFVNDNSATTGNRMCLPKLSNTEISSYSKLAYLHFVRPDVYPLSYGIITSDMQDTLILKIIAGNPEPNWSSIVQVLLNNKSRVGDIIFQNIGAFVPAIVGEDGDKRSMLDGCEKLFCNYDCISAADVSWPHALGGSIVRVYSQSGDPMSIHRLLQKLLVKLTQSSWSVIDAGNLWNEKKSVWFQSLVQLIQPHFVPVIEELLCKIGDGTKTNNDIPQLLNQVLENITDILELFPLSFYKVVDFIQEIKPDNIKPISGSVLVHILISTIYGLISKITKILKNICKKSGESTEKLKTIDKAKIDLLVAFGERLLSSLNDINNPDNITNPLIEKLIYHSREIKEELESSVNTNDLKPSTYERISHDLLSNSEGTYAMKTLYRFICYNVNWIESNLKYSQTPNAIKELLQPWRKDTYLFPDPFDMINTIGGFNVECNFDVHKNSKEKGHGVKISDALDMNFPWDQMISIVIKEGQPKMIRELINHRPEFIEKSDVSSITPEERRQMNNLIKNVLLMNEPPIE